MSELDNLAGGIVAVAVGSAAAAGVEAVLEPARQEAWQESQAKVLDVGSLARLVAQAIVSLTDAEGEATRTGYNANKVAALVQLAMVAPPVSETLDLWRRGKITKDQAAHALDKAQIEPQYHEPILELLNERLAPNQVALGIVRSLLVDPGFLPVTLDTKDGNVPAYPVSTIDPVVEAEASGIDRERLRVMVGEIGLPMALEAAANSVFRGILKRADFNRAVLEGDTRPEWAEAIFEQAKQIPGAATFVTAHLKDWITAPQMYDGTARHGMSQEDTDLLYLAAGRPAAPGQMATAAARGIHGPNGTPMDRAQFLKGIAESDIRPEWGPMLWESRFLYPPIFQITRLVQADAITPAVAKDWAIKDRYPPEVLDALHAYWLTLGGTTLDPHVKKARTALETATHRSFIAHEIDEAKAVANLTTIGVGAEARSEIVALWTLEQDLVSKKLTPAQIKKAFDKAAVNDATGQPWTHDDALAALIELHYSGEQARSYLNIPAAK